MKISRELVCECGNEKSEWADVCDPCRTIEQNKEMKQIIGILVIISVVMSLIVAAIIEYQKQLGNFFNRIEESYLNAFHTLPDFFQTFLIVLGLIFLILFFVGFLVFMMIQSNRR